MMRYPGKSCDPSVNLVCDLYEDLDHLIRKSILKFFLRNAERKNDAKKINYYRTKIETVDEVYKAMKRLYS